MMQPFQTLWARRRVDPRNLDPRMLRIMRILVILGIVTIVMIAVSIAFFAITLVLQALDGILLTLQAVLLTIEHGDIFLKAVLCALILLVVITFVTKRYGPLLRRLFHLLSH
jgi:small basic protein